tara:strand:+ start:812 stop:1111 length:300 start_codon:yes stop_codon:yes gene_type:complete
MSIEKIKSKSHGFRNPHTNKIVNNHHVINLWNDKKEILTRFYSYGTCIIQVINSKVKLDIHYYNYSRTTSKYRNMYLQLDSKQIAEKIASGEIELANLN